MTLQTSKTNVPAEILPYKTEIAVGVVFGPAINILILVNFHGDVIPALCGYTLRSIFHRG